MRKRTVCNRDCPDTCGLVATVEGGRLVRVEGDPDHPVTRGIVCARTRRFPQRQHHPDRLRRPLVRTQGGFETVSWEEALDRIATGLLRMRRESGPEAILHHRSAGSLGALGQVVDAFFGWFGPVTRTRGSVCNGAGKAAQELDFGLCDGHDLLDLEHARNVVLWGKNPLVSNLHAVPFIRDVRRRGGRVVLVDPVWHASARLADAVIQPRPGGDFALACAVAAHLSATGRLDPGLGETADGSDEYLSMLRSRSVSEWAREADVPAEQVEVLADVVSDRPCAFLLGWGMARRGNGGAIVRAIDALCAASGNLGLRGGGASYYANKRGAIGSIAGVPSPARTVPEPALGRALSELRNPPIRAVWVTAANPVAMLPDARAVERGLLSRELVVVVDSFLTDTARCASIVLPTTTLFEDDDLLASYGHHWLAASRPVLEPPGGVLSDLQIVQRLAAVLDALSASCEPLHPRVAGTAGAWKRRLAAPVVEAGVDFELLETSVVRNPLAPDVPFEQGRFPTTSGRMQLVREKGPIPEADGEHPLWLMSNSVRDAQCSQWSVELPEVLPAVCHPEAAPGCSDGEEVLLRNATGLLRVRLSFDVRQRRDVVIVPKGGPLHRGQCANALVPDSLTDLGEGAAYLDARVRIVRAG